jgi:hypothetical protein
MIFEINLLAGKTLVLQHKFVEVMRIVPRFISDYLCLEFREKVRNQLNDSIFRTVVDTSDFALPSDENIGENHRLFANTKRATKFTNSNYGIRVFDLSDSNKFNNSSSPSLKKAHSASIAKSDTAESAKEQHLREAKMAHEHEVTPIIFEECYVKNDDFRFIQQVKRSYEVSEQKITAKTELEGFEKINDYVGVHLFVLQHGFQGNQNDMRMLKNNLSILHPDGVFLSATSNED